MNLFTLLIIVALVLVVVSMVPNAGRFPALPIAVLLICLALLLGHVPLR
jgi:hypothetical protein